MSAEASERWARRGTAQDILTLVRMFDQMDASSKNSLLASATRALAAQRVRGLKTPDGDPLSAEEWLGTLADGGHPDWDHAAILISRVRAAARDGRGGAAQDIINLIALYGAAGAEYKGEILASAAEAIAVQRLCAFTTHDPEPPDPSDWLSELAENTMPTGNGAAGLVGCAAEVEPDAREMIFQEGWLGTVLCASEDELSLGENAYSVYMSIRENADDRPPDPAAYLGIHVPKDDYQEWQDDGWVLNEEAWQAEIRRRCMLEFASMIAYWRHDFFEALLSGRQPSPRVHRPGTPDHPQLADLTDLDIDRLIEEAIASNEPGTSVFDDIPGLSGIVGELDAVLGIGAAGETHTGTMPPGLPPLPTTAPSSGTPTLKPKPRTPAERSKLAAQVAQRVKNATPEQKAAVDKRRSSAASPKPSTEV